MTTAERRFYTVRMRDCQERFPALGFRYRCPACGRQWFWPGFLRPGLTDFCQSCNARIEFRA